MLQIVDFGCTISLVPNEPAAFERIDQLLGFELRAPKDFDDGSAECALSSDVPRGCGTFEV